MLTSIEQLEAELKKSEADNQLNIALLEAQLLTSEAQLKISYLDSLQMKYSQEARKKILALEMERATIEKQKTERKLAATRKIAESDIRQKKLRIMQEKAKAQSSADQINSLILIAQRDGMVQREEARKMMLMSSRGSGTFGGPIVEGTVLMFPSPVLQFPDLSRMQISADASEAVFKKIEKGQRVIITVDASGKLQTTGRINRKSLASSNVQRYSVSKVRSYEVIVDVDSCHSKMKPGLSASCEVFLREEKDTLFVPSLSIFERDSVKVVYVKDRKEFIPVEVGTGTSGSSYTIIKAGLKGDEIIALTEPPLSLITDETVRTDTTKNHNHK
jgi:HlyD family secretion protein